MRPAAAGPKMRIRGGQPIEGELRVSGSKNHALPVLAATLLVSGECRLGNMPRISDVENMLDVLRSLGSIVEWTGANELTVDTRRADLVTLDAKAVKSMRSSVLLMGPLLARFKQVTLPEPGGCIIGNRPLDTHFAALKALGATVERAETGRKLTAPNGIIGTTVILPEFSVTATENAMMAAAVARGRTVIKLAATEPHVQHLGHFLNLAGARISGIGTHTLTIDGVAALGEVPHYDIIPDQIETGTFAVLGALTKGTLRLTGIDPEPLDFTLAALTRTGARFELTDNTLTMLPHSSLRAITPASMLKALPYPGFPTDLQSPFGLLATQCVGTTLIHDPLFDGRLGYVHELIKMGANATICDPHRALISGPTPLYGTEIHGLDLRAGATLVMAGLIAQGETIVHNAEVLDRGYERLAQRLQEVGADIFRE